MSEPAAVSDVYIEMVNKEGSYFTQGNCVMSNFRDQNTAIFCICINHKEAEQVAKAINLLDDNKRRLELE